MLRKLAILTTLVLIVLVVGQATVQAENYGGKSIKYQQMIQHQIHLWFDRLGAANRFICVANTESGYNPTAYNDDDFPVVRYGLFQITWPTWAVGPAQGLSRNQFKYWLYDPINNYRLAMWLYRNAGGLSQWTDGC